MIVNKNNLLFASKFAYCDKSNSNPKPALSVWRIENGKIICTDGKRLIVVESPEIECPEPVNITITTEIIRSLKTKSLLTQCEIVITEPDDTGNSADIRKAYFLIDAMRVEGTINPTYHFPDYLAVFPAEYQPEPIISTMRIDLKLLSDFMDGNTTPTLKFNSESSVITVYGITKHFSNYIGLIMPRKPEPVIGKNLTELLYMAGVKKPIEAVEEVKNA